MTVNTKEKDALDELQPNSIHGPNTSIGILRKSQRTQALALNLPIHLGQEVHIYPFIQDT